MARTRQRRTGPLPGRSGGRPLPKGASPKGASPTGQRDYFAELSAFQDSTIGGTQPGPISKGYGGFQAMDTMSKVKMNNYLNTLPVGGEREMAMNALGYNNGGNPFRPASIPKGTNQFHRGNAKTGGYTAPGIYQHQDAAGNYVGITNVGQDLSAKYNPLYPRSGDQRMPGGGGGMPKPVHTQTAFNSGGGRQPKVGQLPGRDGGRPLPNGGRPGPGGGKPGGKKNAGRPKPGLGAPGIGGFPQMPPTPPNFLPMTPGYEAAYRSANDALSAAEGGYAVGQTMIPAQLGLQQARLDTDKSVETDRLKEELAGRGIYTPWAASSTAAAPVRSASPAGGGVGEALYNRRVATPFGRAYQDLASGGAQQYSDLAQNYAGAQLGYNMDLFNAMQQRADDAYSAMPLSLPIGGYNLPGLPAPMFSTKPSGGRTKPRGKKGKPGRKK